MKDKLDIEQLFKDKFENFEADVNPKLWNNIAKGIQTTTAVSTGMTVAVKALLIGTAAVTVGVATYYFGGFKQDNQSKQEQKNQSTITINKTEKTLNQNLAQPTIIAQSNDPVIDSHKTEIIKELIKHQPTINKIDDNDAQTTLSNQQTQPTINKTDDNDAQTILSNQKTNQNSVSPKVNNTNSSTNNNTSVGSDITKNIIYPSGNISVKLFDNKFKYQFNANANNAVKIIWYFGDGETSDKENPIHIYDAAGEYEVSLTLISEDNEVYQEQKAITIKAESSIDNIPNVITPNGDRINDEFLIKTTNIEEFNIVIKDQFGNVIFESDDKDFTWDGTDLSGNPVKKAVYIYYIFAKGTDGAIYKIPGQLYVR